MFKFVPISKFHYLGRKRKFDENNDYISIVLQRKPIKK